MDLVTYLAFDGRCEEAFKFYEKALGGKILMMMKIADAPPGMPITPGSEKRIMHARLAVGNRLLMGGDAPMGNHSKPQGFSVSIQVDKPADAERMFQALSDGGSVMMPIAETFWAQRFGMLTDKFGIPWMVNCELAGVADPKSKPFVISRTYSVPRDRLWKAFTDPALMQKWWGPKGATVTVSKMDLRPGGRYHYCMRTSDGTEMWGRQVFREIAAPERLVFINSFSDENGGLTRHPFGPTWPIEMMTVFAFTDAGPGKSTFTVTWTPLNPTPPERATFDAGQASMTGGWTGTLDQLADYLAKA